MSINLDINEILRDSWLLIKVLSVLCIMLIYISPGSIALYLCIQEQIIKFGIIKIFLYSIAISIPLNILGLVIVLSPYKTMKDFNKKPIVSFLIVIFGAPIWGIFSAIIIYALVHTYGNILSKLVSESLIAQYIAVYLGLFILYCTHFYISSTIFFKKIGHDE